MSVHVMSWVLRNSEAHLGQRLVLLVLADHAKDDGTHAWPSVGTIAREARMSESQSRQCLRQLEQMGEIKATGKSKSGTVVYSVLMGAPISGPPRNPSEGAPESGPEPSLDQPSLTSLPAAKNGNAKNPVWDALSEIFGEPTTRSNCTLRGKLVASLTTAGATYDEIYKRSKCWPRHFDHATITAEALEKHWDTLGREPLRRPR